MFFLYGGAVAIMAMLVLGVAFSYAVGSGFTNLASSYYSIELTSECLWIAVLGNMFHLTAG